MKSIGNSNQPLPNRAPVMVLPGTVLFPHALMPLFIFEPRYRAMLTHSLEEDRVFCVAMMKPEVTDARSPDDFHHTAGIGLVRACVAHEDGTSHLVLQGLARVDLQSFVQEKPFRIAEIREVRPALGDPAEVARLCAELRKRCSAIALHDAEVREKLSEQLGQISDPAVLGDLVAHTFLRDPLSQQEVLEERDLARRLGTVLRHLNESQDAP
jgi:Lon protease-like protein